MALSGSVKTNAYDGRYYQLDWTAVQSETDNTSLITWALKAIGGNASWYAERDLTVVIAGKTAYTKSTRVERKAGTIKKGTVTVSHKSDGTASLSVSIQAAVYGTSINCTGSGTFTLDTIAQKSTLDVANGADLGMAYDFNVIKKSSNHTNTITWKCGTESGTIVTKSSNKQFTWTPPISLASQNTTGTTVPITFTCITYNGSVNLGSSSKTVGFNIPDSVKPSCTISISDAADPDFKTLYGAYIKGKSKFKIVVNPTLAYGSALTGYKVSANGEIYTSQTSYTSTLKVSGSSVIVTASVTDRRGRTGTASVAVKVLDYAAPKISLFKTSRCNEDGTANDEGGFIKVIFSASAVSLKPSTTERNILEAKISYKKTSGTSYAEEVISDISSLSVTEKVYIFEADTESCYDVKLAVNDAFETISRSTTVSTAFVLMDFHNSGKGVGIGKVAELQGYVDFALKQLFKNNLGICGRTTDGEIVDVMNPVNGNDNTIINFGGYNSGKTKDDGTTTGNTHIYGYDVRYAVKNVKSPTLFKPYYSRGDTENVALRTSGYVTSNKTKVCFFVPLAMPIVGSPTITAETASGFIIVQNGLYTHGSASTTTYAKPTSYEVIGYSGLGVEVVATFSNTTNAINNATAGIIWSGKLKFS